MSVFLLSNKTALKNLIPDGYCLQFQSPGKDITAKFFDTHDWRLWRSGFAAVFSKDTIELRCLDNWRLEGNQPAAYNRKKLLLEGDGPVTEKINKIIYPRALTRQVDFAYRINNCAIRNNDKKIVCRGTVLELTPAHQKTRRARGVLLHPLKGYEKETADVKAFIAAACNQSNNSDPVSLILAGQKDNPLAFQSHKSLGIEAGIPLQTAASNLLYTFTEVMADNLRGIVDDIDPEFLHDYRVCVRKSRAFFSLLKNSLSTHAIEPHRSFLKKCGSTTTDLRDLDVYILEFPHFYKLLPPSLNEHLNAFYQEIQTKRITAHNELRAFLSDTTYKAGIESWRKTLTSGSLFSASAESDSNVVGRKLIAERYKKVCKLASRITDHTPDPDLHALRIECKKLRYCIEFFKAVVNEPVVGEMLTLLKTLQDVLGDFNDLSVQQQWLHDALHSQEAVRGPGVQGAIGGLMTSLYAKQHDYRKLVYEKFALFIDEGVSSRIMRMKKGREATR